MIKYYMAVIIAKTKEALDFFFLKMIEKDRFKPTLYLFKMMIQHTAQIGYTHMAFSLFKKVNNCDLVYFTN